MGEDWDKFHAGVIAIVGAPNVGKSTFLNRVLGRKIVITSPKPQTTRDKVAGILTDEETQIVFLDTPGLVEPRDLLHEALVGRVREALRGIDGVLHLRDASRGNAHEIPMVDLLGKIEAPRVEVWNKTDRLTPEKRRRCEEEIARGEPGRVFAISALKGEGIEALLTALRALLPKSPPLYPPDDLSDRDLRFMAAEAVREKVFELTEEEVPYSVVTQCEEFVERPGAKHYVSVMIYVEHESQKGIVIGRGGSMLKQIGAAARAEVEDLADHPVYLELRVKVRKNWSKKPAELRRFGYRLPKGREGRRGGSGR
jgi:GTP-binding protein Era